MIACRQRQAAIEGRGASYHSCAMAAAKTPTVRPPNDQACRDAAPVASTTAGVVRVALGSLEAVVAVGPSVAKRVYFGEYMGALELDVAL